MIIDRTKAPMTQNHCYTLPYLDLTTDLLPNEEWVDIYGGYYSISNLGRVRSNDRLDTKGRKVKGNAPKGRLLRDFFVNLLIYH